MKMVSIAFGLLVGLATVAMGQNVNADKDLNGVVAPTVGDRTDFSEPFEVGSVIYDASANKFFGYRAVGGWGDFMPTSEVSFNDTVPGETLFSAGDDDIQLYNPSASELTVTIADGFSGGRTLIVVNTSTTHNVLLVDEEATPTTIATVLPGGVARILCIDIDTGSTSYLDWKRLDNELVTMRFSNTTSTPASAGSSWIKYDSEDYDSHGADDTTSGTGATQFDDGSVFKAPIAGKYHVDASAVIGNGSYYYSAGKKATLSVYKETSEIALAVTRVWAASQHRYLHVKASTDVDLDADERITIKVYHDNDNDAGPVSGAADNYLNIHRIGD